MMIFVFLAKVFFFLFLVTSNVFSDIINNIEVEGNKRISKNTIMVLANLKVGSSLDEPAINQILKDLYATNFFKDIKIDFSDGKIKLNIIENPIIENIEIIGVKNKSLQEKLLEIITLKQRQSFTENTLDQDLTIIENTLKGLRI